LLQDLLIEEETLSGLAELKRDAKDFKARIISRERDKLLKIKPLYLCAKALLPRLNLSQKNIHYYASLVQYYTIHDLRKRIKPAQSYLYLLCYIWQRYRQINDNLVDSFCFQLRKLEDEITNYAKEAYSRYLIEQQDEWSVMRKLAEFFVNDNLLDDSLFGDVRNEAFTTVIPKDKLKQHISNLEAQLTEMDFKWEAADKLFHRFRLQLRPLMMVLDFSSVLSTNPYLYAIDWLKKRFNSKQVKDCSIKECPLGTIPKRLQSYLVLDRKPLIF